MSEAKWILAFFGAALAGLFVTGQYFDARRHETIRAVCSGDLTDAARAVACDRLIR